MFKHPDQEEFIQGIQRWFNIFKSIDVTPYYKLKNKTWLFQEMQKIFFFKIKHNYIFNLSNSVNIVNKVGIEET